MTDPKSVAILGATGHVGKALTVHLADRYQLTLYARRPEAAATFAETECPGTLIRVLPIAEFGELEYHAVVNCVGVGNPAVLAGMGGGIFALTEEFDRITLGYLDSHPQSRLICFSSGAAYGDIFEQPANEESACRFHMNPMRPEEF